SSPPCPLVHATACTSIAPPPLHDALPISECDKAPRTSQCLPWRRDSPNRRNGASTPGRVPETLWLQSSGLEFPAYRLSEADGQRSEEHTSELQSRENLVCRLLLETKEKAP